ncbi:MAG: gfo/Idh/MocA family oxidoreductase, partial [bacterium]
MTNRRHFITARAAALTLPSFHLFGADANKTYRTAIIGSGWWGMNILREAIASRRIKVCAVCDVH